MRPYMKICTKCHKEKELVEFYKDLTKKDGRRPDCKNCNKRHSEEYRQTEKGKIVRKLYGDYYNHSEKGKTSRRRYSQTKKGKATQKASHKKTHIRYPERLKARIAVCNAILAGRILKANIKKCYYCNEKAEQHHHYLGYEKEHWLDVQSVCRKCHIAIHRNKAV